MNKLLLFLFVVLGIQYVNAQDDASLENITISYGRYSQQQYKYFEKKYGIGWHSVHLLGSETDDGITTGWLFCSEFEYTGNIAFSPFTIDVVGMGQNISLGNNNALLWGLGFLSLNLDINQEPFGSTLYLSYKYQKFIAESKFVFWNWHKGRDPIFNQQAYYGISYLVANEIALGINCKYYNKQNKYLSLGFKWMFMNESEKAKSRI